MAVNWKKFQEPKSTYPNLEYTPSRAANPRDSHRVYWGMIWAIDDPIWDTIMPPSEWNCFCGVRPTNKPVTVLPDGWQQPETDPVFRNNPGKTGKFVNTEETPYYTETDVKMRAAIGEMAIRLEKKRQQLEDFKLYKEFENGGKVYIHKLKSNKENDYKLVLSSALDFARKGEEVKIGTRLYYDKRGINESEAYKRVYGNLIGTRFEGKSPDLIINNTLFYEVEGYVQPFTSDKISRMLSHGLKQSDKVIINNTGGASDRYIRRLIYSRLNNNASIDEVWLYEKGKLRLFYKTQRGGQ